MNKKPFSRVLYSGNFIFCRSRQILPLSSTLPSPCLELSSSHFCPSPAQQMLQVNSLLQVMALRNATFRSVNPETYGERPFVEIKHEIQVLTSLLFRFFLAAKFWSRISPIFVIIKEDLLFRRVSRGGDKIHVTGTIGRDFLTGRGCAGWPGGPAQQVPGQHCRPVDSSRLYLP